MFFKCRIAFILVLIIFFIPTTLMAYEIGEDVFGICDSATGAFTGKVYEIPIKERNISWLPDFSKLKYKGTFYTKYINIPSQTFEKGFPGVFGILEWYAVRYSSTFEVETEMKCIFRLNSCSGATLYIDEQLIVNNDGRHAPKDAYGNMHLKKGVHKIRVEFYQTGPMDVSLQLFITLPEGKEKLFEPDKTLRIKE